MKKDMSIGNSKNNGNSESAKINLFDERWLPKISDLVGSMGETEKLAIIALVEKDPKEKWDTVAKRVGITSRQLWNIRQNADVQEACYIISKEMFKSDLPDVFKVLSKKAKSGEAWAVKLFLEVSGEKGGGDQSPSNITFVSNLRNEYPEVSREELYRRLREMTGEELTTELVAKINLSNQDISQ